MTGYISGHAWSESKSDDPSAVNVLTRVDQKEQQVIDN
ncbi:hypothetical protein D083_0416 [Dickeya solani RNS 08.23.3.1.A]|nr:hypothetical protein D083_0416 [Dickeya solani RNS 08.23.3.1.A]